MRKHILFDRNYKKGGSHILSLQMRDDPPVRVVIEVTKESYFVPRPANRKECL